MEFKNMQIPVFLINLDTAKHRLERMDAQLGNLKVTYERCSAILGTTFTSDQIAAVYPKEGRIGIDLAPGEIGCFLSHRLLLERVVAENLARVCILEDDLDIYPKFASWLRSDLSFSSVVDILKLESWNARGGCEACRSRLPVNIGKIRI